MLISDGMPAVEASGTAPSRDCEAGGVGNSDGGFVGELELWVNRVGVGSKPPAWEGCDGICCRVARDGEDLLRDRDRDRDRDRESRVFDERLLSLDD